MKRVFIIGFGKFGRRALEQLSQRTPRPQLWLIDLRPEAFFETEETKGEVVQVVEDGPTFLYAFQEELQDNDWIVPALPVHLAWEWLKRVLGPQGKPAQPPTIAATFPFHRHIGFGRYLSYADFLCPVECPAPAGYCYQTGKKRPQPLWKVLAKERVGAKGIEVVVSRQLAPGLGGYPFAALRGLKRLLEKSDPPFYLATACRCHGVIHAINW